MPRGYPGRIVSQAEASRRWRLKNPEKVKEAERRRPRRPYNSESRRRWWTQLSKDKKRKINAVANARATRIRRWLDAYKLSIGCIECGFKAHPVALHFDHVRGSKSFNVCNSKSIAQAQREIKKCEVRCSNCHAIRTFTLLQIKKVV